MEYRFRTKGTPSRAAQRLTRLILDEPVTGLDPAAAQDLYKTLNYLNKENISSKLIPQPP